MPRSDGESGSEDQKTRKGWWLHWLDEGQSQSHTVTQSHTNPIVSHPLSSSLSSFLSHPHTVPSQHSTWLKRSKVKNSKAKIHLHPDCLHQLLSISHTLHTLHPSDVRLCPWTAHLTPHPSHLTLRLYTSPFALDPTLHSSCQLTQPYRPGRQGGGGLMTGCRMQPCWRCNQPPSFHPLLRHPHVAVDPRPSVPFPCAALPCLSCVVCLSQGDT